MTLLQLAEQYMACFYGDAPLKEMEAILADELVFQGPFCEFNSARDYLESLKADPPGDAKYEILQVYEAGDSICFIYRFIKQGISTLMAQTFEIRAGKIVKIILIFDTRAFDT